MKKILILGGTNFIGRNLVESLLKLNSFEITIFNRGITNPKLFPSVDKIIGDRETNDIRKVFELELDYIIDLSCYCPNSLRTIVKKINPSLNRYIFISTCSVYDINNNLEGLKNENSITLSCTLDQEISLSLGTYGNRKAECERILKKSKINYTILRPALIYGPYDSSDRLYYWLHQIKHYKNLLLPQYGRRRFSITYVDDLVETIIKVLYIKEKISSCYNVISEEKISIKEIVKTSQQLLSKENKIIVANSNFLKENNISEWFDIPLWINSDNFIFNGDKLKNEFKIEKNQFSESLRKTISYFNTKGWHLPNYGMENSVKKDLIKKILSNKN